MTTSREILIGLSYVEKHTWYGIPNYSIVPSKQAIYYKHAPMIILV